MPGWLSSLRDVIADATPLRRLMLALLLLLPLLALAAAYLKFNPPVYRVLYTQLSDRSGGEVIAALDQLDIPYRLTAADGTIEVPADQLHAARYRLAARSLPRSEEDRQDEAERAPSFGASSLQEQQRSQRALEIDLARSIQKLSAVELARVHLALPKVSPFLRDAPSATAAVLVRLHADKQLSLDQVTTIQTLVAAAVPRMKRDDVQVLDPSGVLLGEPVPETGQAQRLELERDLTSRVLAVLTPWLGNDRVSVQVTATLEESESRETVEHIRNVVVAGQARPSEKTIRTTRVPEGSIQRIHAVVILGFDASANERWKAGQMARQALGYQAARGDSVKVYAIPVTGQQTEQAVAASAQPELPSSSSQQVQPALKPSKPISIPQIQPQKEAAPQFEAAWLGWIGGGLVVWVLFVMWRHRVRGTEAPGFVMEDFDAELEGTRSQVLADPRVAADVIKLWMRA
ncbi:MAG TPA: flagellar basal-body MS-ring/collar protein FliF [Thiobacillus sp.]